MAKLSKEKLSCLRKVLWCADDFRYDENGQDIDMDDEDIEIFIDIAKVCNKITERIESI